MNLTPVVLQCMILKSHRLQRVCFSCVWIHLYMSVVKAFNQICSFCNANKYFLWTCVLSAVSALTALIQELSFCQILPVLSVFPLKFSSKVHFDFPSLRTFTFLSQKLNPPFGSWAPSCLGALCKLKMTRYFPERQRLFSLRVLQGVFSAERRRLSTFYSGFILVLDSVGFIADLWNALTLKETRCCRIMDVCDHNQ